MRDPAPAGRFWPSWCSKRQAVDGRAGIDAQGQRRQAAAGRLQATISTADATRPLPAALVLDAEGQHHQAVAGYLLAVDHHHGLHCHQAIAGRVGARYPGPASPVRCRPAAGFRSPP